MGDMDDLPTKRDMDDMLRRAVFRSMAVCLVLLIVAVIAIKF